MPNIAPSMFWENVQAHINLLGKNGFNQSAAMLRLYEAERKRQHTAIANLENQLAALSTRISEHGRILGILKRAGIDPETLILTDDIFGEGK
jgi:hypothetical protein